MVRLRREEDKQRLVVGNALLRLTVAGALGCRVEEITIDRSCPDCDKPHGKPMVIGHDLHVSVSHSGDRVGVALTRAGQVGMDVEEINPRVRVADMLRNVLAPGEEAGDIDFFTRWARKEAVLKATGEGLRRAMTKIALGPHGLIGFEQPCFLADLRPGSGYRAAIAVLTAEPVEIVEADGSPLLDRRGDA